MKQIIVVLTLLSLTACVVSAPQGGGTGQAPAASNFNPVSGTTTGSK